MGLRLFAMVLRVYLGFAAICGGWRLFEGVGEYGQQQQHSPADAAPQVSSRGVQGLLNMLLPSLALSSGSSQIFFAEGVIWRRKKYSIKNLLI